MQNLKDIKLPANLKSSEGYLCGDCTSLESIVIPEGFESLGMCDFAECSNLKQVKLPSNLKSIGQGAFNNDTSLESIEIPESVEEIGNYAFEGCDNLTFKVSSERIKALLLNCKAGIDEQKIEVKPAETNNWNYIEKTNDSGENIGYYLSQDQNSGLCFYKINDDCAGVYDVEGSANGDSDSLYIPSSIKVEGKVYKITTMGEGSTKACKYKSIVIPKSITDIEDNALKECTAEEVVLPDTITTMGNGQFSGSNNIKKIKLSESLKVLSKDFLSNSTSDCYPEVILPKKLKKIDDFCFYNVENTKNVESLEFPGGIEEIGAYAFNNYEDLKELKLPANLKKIGEMAFSGESSLENVTIPDNVEEIGQGAFSGCVKLTFTVPCERIKDLLLNCNSGINENNIEVKDLNAMHWNYYESGALTGSNAAGSYCYDRTTGLTYRKVDDNSVELTKVRDQYDYEEEYKDVVNVPATIEVDDKTYEVTSLSKGSIGKNCIYKKIVLPDTLVSIGDGILGKYNNIEIVLPDSLINMGNNQFCYSDIKEINLPKNLKEIGKYCFENCSSLVSINIPDSVEKIGACSFSFCPNLKEVKLPSSLKEIEDSMFSYSKGLEAIDIPDSVENIGYYAFQNCANLKEVKLPSNLKEIEGYAFYNDKNLEQIYIPDSVEKIGEHAFQGCSNVTITVGSERVKELLLDCHCFLNKDKIIVVQ